MNALAAQTPGRSPYLKGVAILALVFGIATVLSGGNVLFGSDAAREMAGAYVPFVVWFNFLAGFFYVLAAIGIWLGRSWAFTLSVLIAAATGMAALVFGYQVIQGGAYEMRTVGALALRIGVWTVIAVLLCRPRRPS